MSKIKNFAWPVTSVEKPDYDVVLKCIQTHTSLFNEKNIIIFGAGIRGTLLSVILENEGFSNIKFTDNNPEKWGGLIDKYTILSPDKALLEENSFFVIATEEGKPIKEQLESYGQAEGKDFLYPMTELYDNYIEEFYRNTSNKYLIMGDCMFAMVSFRDSRKNSLSEMLYHSLGYDNTKLLTMHGMGLRAFYHIFKLQVLLGMRPTRLAVMVNFETLTGKQHLLPRSQHTELISRISNTVPVTDQEFDGYTELVHQRVQNVQAEFFTTSQYSTNSLGKIDTNASKLFFRMNYMYRLSSETEGVVYLRKILQYANQHSVKAIPFIPPVNYELAEELFGDDFCKAYHYNYNLIKDLVISEGGELLDLSHICKKEDFSDPTTPDETTNYSGRKKVARKIKEALEDPNIV